MELVDSLGYRHQIFPVSPLKMKPFTSYFFSPSVSRKKAILHGEMERVVTLIFQEGEKSEEFTDTIETGKKWIPEPSRGEARRIGVFP